MRFDKTINLGHVLTTVTMLVCLGAGYANYKITVTDHESRIRQLESQNSVLSNQLTAIWSVKQDVAVIKDRLERVPGGK